MLKEIRRIAKNGKRKYMYNLLCKGMLKKHIDEKGYVCYDTEEFKEFRRHSKVGRPPKI